MEGVCNYNDVKTYNRNKIYVGIFMIISLISAIGIVAFYVFAKYQWINVHLVPHSHNDVGWLEDPETYYKYYVKYILDHVVLELQKNPSRKFVYAETYYFWKWWQEQTESTRKNVRELIRTQQLEFVNGGWCMSDEAVTHYQSFIDQSTWGFRFLNDTFGDIACPKVAWQIDTFGHSKGIASLLAQMDFQSLFFARIDFNERKYRKSNKLMEFVWVADENLGSSGSIFTSVFYNHYSAPNGFDFEEQPFQDGLDCSSFYKYVRTHATYFKTNNILVPMGDDFRYFNAKKYFFKLDMLISFFDNNPDFGLKVFYSTPSVYLSSLLQTKTTWPVHRGDFFPYASELHTYWTGFYSSRPALKYFERISNNLLQVTKQLLVLSGLGMCYTEELTVMREAMGVLQHHDAITGTSQQRVASYYAHLLYKGISACQKPIENALGKLTFKGKNPKSLYKTCLLLNISSCDVTEKSSRFVVTVYNSLSRSVDHFVRIPVSGKQYCVLTAKGEKLKVQMLAIPKVVRNIPGRNSTAKAELLFKATHIPPMGFKSFFVMREDSCMPFKRHDNSFTEKKIKLTFDPKTQLLMGIEKGNCNVSLFQSLRYYLSAPHESGAYLFKPGDINPFPLVPNVKARLLNKGELVDEYEQVFSKWASQVVRIYKDEEYVEFEWLVGPIPVGDKVGKDVILIYSSEINSRNVFYTDVNGMGMIKRKRNFGDPRAQVLQKLAGNYYPVTTMISIKDGSHQLFVVVDRPQGGSSLRNGQIELMVHRRLFYDDERGVNEALNEMAFGVGLVVRGRHWLLFGPNDVLMDQEVKMFAQMRHSEPWLFFVDASYMTLEEWRKDFITEFSGISAKVPPNVHILTLEPWRENTVLLRLEHIFEKFCPFPSPDEFVWVSLKDLFNDYDVVEAKETTLGANKWLSNATQLPLKRDEVPPRPQDPEPCGPSENMTVSLRPRQIRTFLLQLRPKTRAAPKPRRDSFLPPNEA